MLIVGTRVDLALDVLPWFDELLRKRDRGLTQRLAIARSPGRGPNEIGTTGDINSVTLKQQEPA